MPINRVKASVSNLEFFTVSLPENIPTLIQSTIAINKFYNNPEFTIICPVSSLSEFKSQFKNQKNIKILSEVELITYDQFKEITLEIAKKVEIQDLKLDRLGWYYQQSLKLSYLFTNRAKNISFVMWDADTIPLTKINFFEKDLNHSIFYGSVVEYNEPYFETIYKIFGDLPKKFIAFTIQFFSCTQNELLSLEKRILDYLPNHNNDNLSVWISKVIITSVLNTHSSLDGSFFSEQEFVGLSNMMIKSKKQIPLKHLRWGLNGYLSLTQLRLARLFGFKHVTYEKPSLLNGKKQRWKNFLILLYIESKRFKFR